MDQVTFVEDKIFDGRRFVERFAADGHPVAAAFWIKTTEEDWWFLYVATDLYDIEGPAGAYKAVHESSQRVGETCVSSSQIKIVSPNSPIVKDILALTAKANPGVATRIGSLVLGSISIEEGYIYPKRVFLQYNQGAQMTRDEVGREIVRLMSRDPAVLQPSSVLLKDGTSFAGVPFSLQSGRQQALVAQFIADGELAPKSVPLDSIAFIQ